MYSPEDLSSAFYPIELEVLEKAVPIALAALGAAQANTRRAEAALQKERRHTLHLEKQFASALFAAQQADRAAVDAIHELEDSQCLTSPN